MIDVKIRKVHPDAVIPTYAHPGDAGMDVTAVERVVNDDYIEYDTGLQFELPPGYVMLIFPRSSISNKTLSLANSVGVLDSTYRGNLKLRFRREFPVRPQNTTYFKIYNTGDRVGQIMIIPYPEINFTETEDFEDTERGSGGFGSSGN